MMMRTHHHHIILLLVFGFCEFHIVAGSRLRSTTTTTTTSDHHHDEDEEDTPTTTTGFEMTKELANKVLNSVGAINVLHEYEEEEEGQFDSKAIWTDIDDAVLAAKVGSECYVAFRGTDFSSPLDVWQLFTGCQEDYEGCRVQSGAKLGYLSCYLDEFQQFVATCMEDATDLILTGFSQGGGVAVAASIGLRDYNPIVITFGATRALAGPCDHIDSSRHYRFVNAGMGENDKFAYDLWASELGHTSLKHFGHAFLMDFQSTSPGVYLGLDTDVVRTPGSFLAVHNPTSYWASLNHLLASVDDTKRVASITGWEIGHWCTKNDECESKTCFSQQCSDSSTVKLAANERCTHNSDCESEVCSRDHWLARQKKCN